MSLLITRSTPLTYDERMRRTDRLGVVAVATITLAILAAAFAPATWHSVSYLIRTVSHSGAVAGSRVSNLPLDAAFAAIIGVVVVAIGLAFRERRADEDREVFDVR